MREGRSAFSVTVILGRSPDGDAVQQIDAATCLGCTSVETGADQVVDRSRLETISPSRVN